MHIEVSAARSHIDSVTSQHIDTVGHSPYGDDTVCLNADGPEMLTYRVTKHSA